MTVPDLPPEAGAGTRSRRRGPRLSIRGREISREALPMLALTLSEGMARLVSFVVNLLAARALAPEGFGVVRYTTTIATLAFGAVQVLAMAVTRELGSARGNVRLAGRVLGATALAALVLTVLSGAAAAAAHVAGLTGSADLVGLLAMVLSLSAFQVYYGVGRGLGDPARAALTYVGGSLIALALVLALVLLTDPGPRTVLIALAASSLLAILAYEVRSPLRRRFPVALGRSELAALWAVGAPLLLGHLLFMTWQSADQIWVENRLGTEEIGLYGAAKNLAQLLVVIPSGVSGALLPRIAELRAAGDTRAATRLTWAATGVVMAVSLVIAGVVIALRNPLLEGLYGAEYRAGAASMVGLVLAVVFYGAFITLTNAAIGWGRPAVYVVGLAVATASELALLSLASASADEAAWAYAGSAVVAAGLVAGWLLARPLGGRRPA